MRMEQRPGRVRIPHPDKQEKIITDKIMLRLSHLAIISLLSLLGYLMTSYLGNLDKAISKITQTQEQLTIMVTRVDETVRNLDHRLERIENKKP
jgi:hypothetical protein